MVVFVCIVAGRGRELVLFGKERLVKKNSYLELVNEDKIVKIYL